VGADLSQHLPSDKKVHIITCENASHPSKTLRESIQGKTVAVSEATVFCTTIEDAGIHINSENYPYLQCDADLLEGYVPPVASVRAIGNFSDFLTRKLFTYNAASCVIAYVGALLGYTDYGAAANDPAILALLDKNYAATNVAMCKRFGYELQDQTEFALLSKKKFCDRTIVDTVARNAREPHRKLGAGERIIGAAALLREQGEDASVLELTAAAALLYQDPADAVWTNMQQEKGIEGILRDICGLTPGDRLHQNITDLIPALKQNPKAAICAILPGI
jgi:mannitol-1-phosphate 5-dehydrogenase